MGEVGEGDECPGIKAAVCYGILDGSVRIGLQGEHCILREPWHVAFHHSFGGEPAPGELQTRRGHVQLDIDVKESRLPVDSHSCHVRRAFSRHCCAWTRGGKGDQDACQGDTCEKSPNRLFYFHGVDLSIGTRSDMPSRITFARARPLRSARSSG